MQKDESAEHNGYWNCGDEGPVQSEEDSGYKRKQKSNEHEKT
jgi:hypothetical protein